MNKFLIFNLLLALIAIVLLGCQLDDNDKNVDKMYLDDKIKEINIQISNKMGEPNPILFISFTDEDSIEILKSIITSATRVDGIVDIREPDGGIDIIYEGDSSEYLYLWIGEKGEMGALMKDKEQGILYNLSAGMNEKLINMIQTSSNK